MEKETALKILRELHDNGLFSVRTALETLIPELTESEDERIKKEIIRFIQMEVEDEMVENKWLAWLEKQGETSKQSVNTLEWTKDDADTLVWLCRIIYRAKQDRLITQEEENFISEWIDKWLNHSKEKQGEQSDFNVKDYNNIDPHFAKPTDKVEPKFKVGDWVACEELNTALIVNIDDDKYEVEFIDGNKGFPHIDYIDKMFHLWTIEDAKEGDVLSWDDSKCIVLFKKIHNEESFINSFSSYGFIGGCTGIFDVWKSTYHGIGGAHPATKEERDTLFTKMKEAGYEWDAEKKELKKLTPYQSNYCKENCKGFQETGKCLCDGDCKDKIENDLKKN